MKKTFRSRGHAFLVCDDRLFQFIRSASCQATASVDFLPRRIAREASFAHFLIPVSTLALLVFDFPLDLRMNSHANNGV